MRIVSVALLAMLGLVSSKAVIAEPEMYEVKAGEPVPGFEAVLKGGLQACRSREALRGLVSEQMRFGTITQENWPEFKKILDSYDILNREDGCLIRTQSQVSGEIINVIDHAEYKIILHVATDPSNDSRWFEAFYVFPETYTKIE